MNERGRAPHDESASLDRLERVLGELLRLRGFTGGRLFDAALDLDELAARDGGLPLFLAQAAVWAEYLGLPHLVEGHAAVADPEALAKVRAVSRAKASSSRAPLLFLLNHVVHLARSASAESTLAIETVIETHHPGVLDALSLRRGPPARAPHR